MDIFEPPPFQCKHTYKLASISGVRCSVYITHVKCCMAGTIVNWVRNMCRHRVDTCGGGVDAEGSGTMGMHVVPLPPSVYPTILTHCCISRFTVVIHCCNVNTMGKAWERGHIYSVSDIEYAHFTQSIPRTCIHKLSPTDREERLLHCFHAFPSPESQLSLCEERRTRV